MKRLLHSPKTLAPKKLSLRAKRSSPFGLLRLLRNDSFLKNEVSGERCGVTRNDRFNPASRSNWPGQSLVEFALLLPVFVLAVIVVFDLGRAVYYYSAIHNAAREGARYGIVHPTDAVGMKNKAVNYAIGLGLATANVIAGAGPDETIDGFANPTVKVTVLYSFAPATPLLGQFIPGGQISLKSEAIMRTEVLP